MRRKDTSIAPDLVGAFLDLLRQAVFASVVAVGCILLPGAARLERYHALAIHSFIITMPCPDIEVEKAVLKSVLVNGLTVDTNRTDSLAVTAHSVAATAGDHWELESFRR